MAVTWCTDLVAGGAARLDELGVVTLAVDDAVLVAVGQVHQLLLALRAHETSRMPAQVLVHATRVHCHVTSVDVSVARVTTLKQMTSHVNK